MVWPPSAILENLYDPCPKYLCCINYYDICFLANLRSPVLGRHTLGQDSVSCAGMVALPSFMFELSLLNEYSRELFIYTLGDISIIFGKVIYQVKTVHHMQE